MDIDEYFLHTAGGLYGDDDYITNGTVLASKLILKNDNLRAVNNPICGGKKIKSAIPKEEGILINLAQIGRECIVLDNYFNIGIRIHSGEYADYRFVNMFYQHDGFDYFTVQRYKGYHDEKKTDGFLVKAIGYDWIEDEHFMMGMFPSAKEMEID